MPITTAEELLRARGLGRCELVRGELRRMNPAGDQHGRITATLTHAVAAHVKAHGLGVIHGAETGFILRTDPDTVRAPDLAFTRVERASPPVRGFVPVPPDLAVEVLSPDDRPGYVHEKVEEWLDAGVRAVWVVDPAARAVTVHTRGERRRFAEADVLPGGELLPGFRLPVRDIFA